MATNTLPDSEISPNELEVAENSKKKISATQNGLPITSETEYSQESSYQANTSGTKDAATEACIEVDSVCITTEIYSMTDLPSSLQPEEQTEPKPGMILPEYFDGKCMILRAYRCKGVNTGLCEILKCIFPSDDAKKKLYRSNDEAKKKEIEEENVHAFRLATTIPPAQITKSRAMCKDTCPNLIVSQGSQTDDAITVCRKPEEQAESTEITVSMKGDGKPTMEARVDLTMIEEQEEDKDEGEGPQMDTQETERDDKESVTVSEMDESRYQSAAEDIIPKQAELTVDEDKTREIGVGDLDAFSENLETDGSSRRSPTRDIFNTGTMISKHSTTWLLRPKRRDSNGVICPQGSESYCFDGRTYDNLTCCSKITQPLTNHCMIQCDMVRNNLNTACSTSDRLNPCESPEYYASRYIDRGNRCCNEESSTWREQNEFWPTRDYWTSKSKRSLGSFQESFMRHQPGRINNTHGCSIAGGAFENCVQNRSNRNNACNRYYLNFNKAYNTIGRYCLCNNRYNIRNANTRYCAMGNQTVYHTPNSYHYSFNAWY